MKPRLLALLLLALPIACHATVAAPPEAPAPQPIGQFVHRAQVSAVPAGAQSVRLQVNVPAQTTAGTLTDVTAAVLVGNSSVEVALQPGVADTFESATLSLSWSAAGELVLKTEGKPVELDLCFALLPVEGAVATEGGSEAAVEELERELAAKTVARIDERSADPVRTRFERVR